MSRCHLCRRPLARSWQSCSWCGASQLGRPQSRGIVVYIAQGILLLQALVLIGGTASLLAFWGMQGWVPEQGRTLAFIWLGVVGFSGLLVWLNANLGRALFKGETHRVQ